MRRSTSPQGRLRTALLLAGLLAALANPAALPVAAAPARTAAAIGRGNCPNPPRPTAPNLPHGALAMYCVPANWNGGLVVWAHGYVDVTQPIGFYHLTFPDGNGGIAYLPDLVESLGFAFATTSYRTNGLAILGGVQDIEELVDGFPAATGQPKPQHTYQVGVSEGGLITTLLAERSPQRFSGALAACGPIGDFRSQINYVGDMRVLFDAFYPGVLPGSPILIPEAVTQNWTTTYLPAVQRAIAANPDHARQLYRVESAPVNPDPAKLDTTATDVLWYNVFGANDARAKLDGNPYDNATRFYVGSDNDLLVNLVVHRVSAEPSALANLRPYETTGRVTIPLVTLHTTGDDVIPFWHEIFYFVKTQVAGGGKVTLIPVDAYGHCHFTLDELLGAFALLVFQVSAQPVPGVQMTDPQRARTEIVRRAAGDPRP